MLEQLSGSASSERHKLRDERLVTIVFHRTEAEGMGKTEAEGVVSLAGTLLMERGTVLTSFALVRASFSCWENADLATHLVRVVAAVCTGILGLLGHTVLCNLLCAQGKRGSLHH